MSNQINILIQKLGIPKSKFAERLNVSQAFVSQMCSGVREPSDRTIADICREFGCDEVWLRTGEGNPFREETRQELIMRFATQTLKGSDEFRKAVVAALAKLEPEDWQNLAKIFAKLNEAYKKE